MAVESQRILHLKRRILYGIEITDLKFGKSHVTEEIHFSGGLKGTPTNLGWALFPTSEDQNSDALVFKIPKAHLEFATRECGIRFIGSCMKYSSDTNSPPMGCVGVWGARS